MKETLTTKEVKVLQLIQKKYAKKLRLNIHVKSIAKTCEMSEMEVEEMLRQFKEKGLLKPTKKNVLAIAEVALEILFELV